MIFSIDCELRRAEQTYSFQFSFESGIVAVMGASGSGKTTLLDIISGFEKPQKGKAELAGRILFDQSSNVFVECEQRRIGYVLQSLALFPHKNVFENVAFGLWSAPAEERVQRVKKALQLVRAEHVIDRDTRTLSGGEAQRVALARAIVCEPEMLLLDEAFVSLDHQLREAILSDIRRLIELSEKPCLCVTHSLADAEKLTNYAVGVSSGKLIAQGTPQEVWSALAGT